MSNKKEIFIGFFKSVKRDGAAQLLEWLESTDFFTAPASTVYHGCHEGGLCEHSVNVLAQMLRLLDVYSGSIGRDAAAMYESAIICALLHDVCKVDTYTVDYRNVKDDSGHWVKAPFYKRVEQLNYGGHGSKSVYLISQHMLLTPEEAVAINCHMSCWDGDKSVDRAFGQYPFAWLLHVADEAAKYIDESGQQ